MNNDFDHQVLTRHAYGLIDPLMAEHLPEGIKAEPLVPLVLEESAHLMPRLLVLRTLTRPQQDGLLECLYRAHQDGEPPLVALFLESAASTEDVVRHWNGMQVAAPKPELKFWLRLHDPRVLHQLLRIANADQRRRIFGHAESLTYWLDGAWTSARPSDADFARTSGPGGGAIPFGGAVRWDWPRVERIGMVNRALAAAGVTGAAQLTRQGARAEQLFELAVARHGLADTSDIIEFAARGLTLVPDFDRHPEVSRAIPPRPAEDDDSNLADRFALLDDAIWQQLRQVSVTDKESI